MAQTQRITSVSVIEWFPPPSVFFLQTPRSENWQFWCLSVLWSHVSHIGGGMWPSCSEYGCPILPSKTPEPWAMSPLYPSRRAIVISADVCLISVPKSITKGMGHVFLELNLHASFSQACLQTRSWAVSLCPRLYAKNSPVVLSVCHLLPGLLCCEWDLHIWHSFQGIFPDTLFPLCPAYQFPELESCQFWCLFALWPQVCQDGGRLCTPGTKFA